jgi:hypothetical protein
LVRFVRNTLLQSLGYALFVVLICIATDLIVLNFFGAFRGHWAVSDIVSGLCVGAAVYIMAWQHRESDAEISLYQSHAYYQKIKVGNSIQTLFYLSDSCNHIGDPEHQKCRAAARREFMAIRAAICQPPCPDIVRGNKPQVATAAGVD